jgi:ferredoxin
MRDEGVSGPRIVTELRFVCILSFISVEGAGMAELIAAAQGATLRAFADRERCCGYGICTQLCPEVFKVDADGLVYVENEIVPAAVAEQASEAAESCPAQALRVVADSQ